MYVFPVAVLILFLLGRWFIKLPGGLALLLAGALAYILAGGPEPLYRYVLALGSVTNLLILMALGALVVECLHRRGILSRLVSWGNRHIPIPYVRHLFFALVAALPGMLSGSFFMSRRVTKDLWAGQDKGFVRAAVLLGVLAPPLNPYIELLILGRGWQMTFDYGILLLLLLIPLFLLPLCTAPGDIQVAQKKTNPLLLHLTAWPVLLYVLMDLGMKLGWLDLYMASPIPLLFLLIYLFLIHRKETLREMEEGIRGILPGMAYILGAGFLISLAPLVGFRGEMVLFLSERGGEGGLLLLGSLLLGLITPVASLIFLGVPAVAFSVPDTALLTGFFIFTVTAGTLIPWPWGIEGTEGQSFSLRYFLWALVFLGAGLVLALEIIAI